MMQQLLNEIDQLKATLSAHQPLFPEAEKEYLERYVSLIVS